MRRRHIAITLCLGLLAVAGPTRAQTDFSKVEIKATQLSASTYMLTGAGGNIGLSVGEDAVFIVDDQFAPLAPKIKAAIAAITPRPVKFVFNTHFHFDHTGGNEALGQDGAVIVAHDNVRQRLSSAQVMGFINAQQAASPKAALPVITVASGISFHINGETVEALHVPRAHTDGDMLVHFKQSDVLHMGDTFFNGFYPFIDTASGGTADGMVAAHDRALAIASDKTKIIPGHGPLASRKDLQTQRDMLATVTQRIKDLRRAGKTDAEVRAANPAADFDATYGKGFIGADRFVLMMLDAVPR